MDNQTDFSALFEGNTLCEEDAAEAPVNPFFADWLEASENDSIPDWVDLPDIDLYMDQVIKYMQNQLSRSNISDSEKNITSSMINNYTKEGILERPERRRYNKKHIASLMMICLLKQVLPIGSVKQLFDYFNDSDGDFARVYSAFYEAQQSAFSQTAEYANSRLSSESTDIDKCMLAIELASKSNAMRLASQRLIESINKDNK